MTQKKEKIVKNQEQNFACFNDSDLIDEIINKNNRIPTGLSIRYTNASVTLYPRGDVIVVTIVVVPRQTHQKPI